MNNMSFMIWFSVYACAMITLGWYVSRKQKTGEDFLLGGRSLPMILTLGSTVGTMVGTGSSVGAVGFGYSKRLGRDALRPRRRGGDSAGGMVIRAGT
ncbi:Pantothenate:Na+ symporter [Klebsiella pneumoniae]|nr:Pantothenate:Na+ symporter [Klebsiella pneumoniae]